MEELLLEDPVVADAVYRESRRQLLNLELIASENFVSPAVRAAHGSLLTHKYAEGYPGKRYYGGCEAVDVVETIAIERACSLFGAEYANVQPHSGSQANMAAYFALIQPGDTILGMDLRHGGHLTHGSPVNFSGRLYNVQTYGVDQQTGTIDYDNVATLAEQHRPKLIIAGASAYARTLDFARFKKIADSVGAYLVVDMAHIAGLIASGHHPNPIPHADIVTTTTHKTLRGPRGGMILASSNLAQTLNSQIFPGIQGGPLMHVIAAKAVALGEAQRPAFTKYCQRVVDNAKWLAACLMSAGYPIVSNGTDNHLMLLDLTTKNITGKDAEVSLDKAGITANKNTIPFETRSPFITSGVRLGTAALTTRGMDTRDMETVAAFIVEALQNWENESRLKEINAKVRSFTTGFPLFIW